MAHDNDIYTLTEKGRQMLEDIGSADAPAALPTLPDSYEDFLAELEDKLLRGQADYGDASFDKPAQEILDELQAEALDLAGWGYVLWEKIERVRRRLRESAEVMR